MKFAAKDEIYYCCDDPKVRRFLVLAIYSHNNTMDIKCLCSDYKPERGRVYAQQPIEDIEEWLVYKKGDAPNHPLTKIFK